MKPAIVPITIYQGQTFDDTFVFQDPDGDPQDFTGYTARMQIRPAIEDDTIVLELTTANTYIAPLGVDGTLTFAVPADITSDLSTSHLYETWWYDLEIENGAGNVQRLLQGPVIFWPETTR